MLINIKFQHNLSGSAYANAVSHHVYCNNIV